MLTPEEKQIAEELKAQGRSTQEIAGYIGGLRKEVQQPEMNQGYDFQEEPQEESFSKIKDIPSDLKETGQGIKNVITSAGEGFGESLDAYNRGEQGFLSTAYQGATKLATAVPRVVGEIFKGGLKVLSKPSTEKKTSEALAGVGQKIYENPRTQQWLKNMEALKKENPEMARNIVATMEGGEYLLEFLGLGAAKKAVTETAGATTKVVKNTVTKAKQAMPAPAVATAASASQKGVEALTESYVKSFVGNNKSVLNKLDKLVSMSSNQAKRYTIEDLFGELAQNGYTPNIKGELADMSGVILDIEKRQKDIFDNLIPLLEKIPDKVNLNDLKKSIVSQIKSDGRFSLDFERAVSEVDRVFASLVAKYGNDISLADLQRAKIQATKKSKAFKSELFEQDVSNVIGRTFGGKLDELVPDKVYKEANKRWGDLERMSKTASAIDNQKIGIGPLGGKVGQLGGAMLLGGAAFPISGPGSLVIAGLAATYGGNQVAKYLRYLRFNPNKFNRIISEIKQDKALIQKLLSESTGIDKKFLEQKLLGPGIPEGTPEKPFIMRGPTEFEKPAGKIIKSENVKAPSSKEIAKSAGDDVADVLKTLTESDFYKSGKLNTDALNEWIELVKKANKYKGKLTPEEIQRARELIKLAGKDFKSPPMGEIDLLSEALKYPTAEDFVKANTFYRGVGKDRVINPDLNAVYGKGTYITPSKEYAGKFGEVKSYQLSPDAKIIKLGTPEANSLISEFNKKIKPKYKFDGYLGTVDFDADITESLRIQKAWPEFLQSKGFDVLEAPKRGTLPEQLIVLDSASQIAPINGKGVNDIVVPRAGSIGSKRTTQEINPLNEFPVGGIGNHNATIPQKRSVLQDLSKSQLTDIWKEANKK